MDILKKVTEVVAEVLEMEPSEIQPDANLIKDLGMDSVLAIDITTALEKFYKVRVPDAVMEELVTARAIEQVIIRLLAEAGEMAKA